MVKVGRKKRKGGREERRGGEGEKRREGEGTTKTG